jgi:hypothetical protein
MVNTMRTFGALILCATCLMAADETLSPARVDEIIKTFAENEAVF